LAFSDRELTCRDCGSTFIFTSGEQEFYATKGLQHDPVRCPSCRANRRTMRPEDREEAPSYGVFVSWGGRTPRQLHAATCHECGQTTEIPFLPRGDRPVFCSNCYNAVRERQEAAEEAAQQRLASIVSGGGGSAPAPAEVEGEREANTVVPARE
jgi:CxxC-x17-CxxC domain-containing protein